MTQYYDFLDDQINSVLRADIGFNNLVSTKLFEFSEDEREGFRKRYALIREFQTITRNLFRASLNGDFDPDVADLVINELPEPWGLRFHRQLTEKQHALPVFFRTDEVIPGKISEIQSPGSAWGLYEQLFSFYNHFSGDFGSPIHFSKSLSACLSDALFQNRNQNPIVHHLLDNASIPHGMRYFIQQTRKHGVRYFGYDRGIVSDDCNFVRAHAFQGLLSDNFCKHRLKACEEGRITYDLPPSIVFDEKISMMFPFWEKTEHFYSDEIRSLFPFTQIIAPDGFRMEDGRRISLEDFSSLSQKKRCYYIKYAGSDLSMNWGSRGVFFAGSLSGVRCSEILKKISEKYHKKQYWILQKGFRYPSSSFFLSRSSCDNEETVSKSYSKFSGFYGPKGVMGILIMQRHFHKIHGTDETVVTIAE